MKDSCFLMLQAYRKEISGSCPGPDVQCNRGIKLLIQYQVLFMLTDIITACM